MLITKKIRLIPTDEQEKLLFECCGVARFSYNLAKHLSDEYYKENKKSLKENEIRKYITQLKKSDEYKWLNNYSCDIPKQAVKDFNKARVNSFRKYKNGYHTNFKSKKDLFQSFYSDIVKTKIGKKNVRLSKIGLIKTSRQFPRGKKIYNPRVIFDGLYWYMTISYDRKCEKQALTNNIIGIDLGIKELLVTSSGLKIANINKSSRVKKLEKLKKSLQRKINKNYRKEQINKSKKYIKLKLKHLKVSRRLENIRDNHIHQATSLIVKGKPCKIVIEDLDISNMMKNKKLAKAIKDQKLNFLINCLKYKCELNGIDLVKASRTFPSSRICNVCNNKYDDKLQSEGQWSLKIRKWRCNSCGTMHDRDVNAAINLSKWVG